MGVIVELAINKRDIQSARELIARELFQPAGHRLTEANDLKEGVLYVIAKDENKVVGAGRLAVKPNIHGASKFFKALDHSLSLTNQTLGAFKDKIAVMYGLVLEPSYRSKGIGSRLYDLRESIAQENKKKLIVSRIRLDSWKIYSNRLYTEFGSDEVKLLNGVSVVRKWVYKII